MGRALGLWFQPPLTIPTRQPSSSSGIDITCDWHMCVYAAGAGSHGDEHRIMNLGLVP